MNKETRQILENQKRIMGAMHKALENTLNEETETSLIEGCIEVEKLLGRQATALIPKKKKENFTT